MSLFQVKRQIQYNHICQITKLISKYIKISKGSKSFIAECEVIPGESNEISINHFMRTHLDVVENDIVKCEPYENDIPYCDNLVISVSLLKAQKIKVSLEIKEIQEFLSYNGNNKIVQPGISLSLSKKIGRENLAIFVITPLINSISFVDENTKLEILNDTNIDIIGMNIFRSNVDFSKIGIGGLKPQLEEIRRRIILSRLFDEETLKKLGIQHVRGVLLSSIAGCGKTFLCKKLSESLNAKFVEISGIKSKWVGESEQNMNKYFDMAKNDPKNLYFFFIDEADELLRTRTSGDRGYTNGIVNEFLKRMDGIETTQNFIIFLATNRPDILDEAVIRNGRIDVKLQIPMPDFEARRQIFEIHTSKMKDNLKDVNFDLLSEQTEGMTGADIFSIIQNASSFALQENVDENNNVIKDKEIIITGEHFNLAIKGIRSSNPYSSIKFVETKFNGSKSNFLILDDNETSLMNGNEIESLNSNDIENKITSYQYAINMSKKMKLNIKHIDPIELMSLTELEICDRIVSTYKDVVQMAGCLIIKNIDMLIGILDGQIQHRRILLTLKLLLKENFEDNKIKIIMTSSELLNNIQYNMFEIVRIC